MPLWTPRDTGQHGTVLCGVHAMLLKRGTSMKLSLGPGSPRTPRHTHPMKADGLMPWVEPLAFLLYSAAPQLRPLRQAADVSPCFH